jgi:hypothetical protein
MESGIRQTFGSNKRGKAYGVAAIVLATAALAACQSPQQVVSQKEDSLSAAGFIVRPANTPERQAMLNSLPPHHFVQRTHGDTIHYVYADPLVCDCLYVGSQQAHHQYMLHVQQKRLADEQELTAAEYNDPAWNWGAWGPWGPGEEFGYGPGFGW